MKGENEMEMEKNKKTDPYSKLKFLLKTTKSIYTFYILFSSSQKQNLGVKRV